MAMSHADSLQALLCGATASADESTATETLAACHSFIVSCTVCRAPNRPNDLVLQMFIEAADQNWHVDIDGRPSARRALFNAYLAAGHIRMDRPVCWSTAREALNTDSSSRPPNTWPLEIAMRRGSVATTVALLEAGADEFPLANPTEPSTPDLARSAWLLPNDRNTAPLMAAAVTEVLMRRRLSAVVTPNRSTSRRKLSL